MNALLSTPLGQGWQWKLRRYVRKTQRVMDDPRLLADVFVVPHLSPQWLVGGVQLRSLLPFRTAARLSHGWDWARLSDFVRSLDHPVVCRIGHYLENSAQDIAGAKAEAAEGIRQDILNHRLLQCLPQRELWDASRVVAQFGFFDAALALRLAVLGRLLQHPKTPVNLRHQVNLELAGMMDSELESLAHDYGLNLSEAILSGQSDGQRYSVREILNVYLDASESWREKKRNQMPPESFRRLQELGKNRPDFSGEKILFVGPSLRDSEPISTEWPDRVMRVGYMGPSSTADGEEWPTDIAFYRDHKLSGLTTDAVRELFADRHVLLSNINQRTLSRLPSGSCAFYSQFSGAIFMQKEPNAGPEAVMCVLDCGASEVHLTNMDLHLNNVYPPGYVRNYAAKRVSNNGRSLEMEAKCRSMALNHPPVSQFSILKLFVQRGVLTGDDVLTKILGDSVRAYCARLQDSYHPFVGHTD